MRNIALGLIANAVLFTLCLAMLVALTNHATATPTFQKQEFAHKIEPYGFRGYTMQGVR